MPDEGSQNSSGDGGEEAIRLGNSLRALDSTKLGACAVRAPLRPHARASTAMQLVFQRSGVFADGMSEVHDLGQELVDSLMWT